MYGKKIGLLAAIAAMSLTAGVGSATAGNNNKNDRGERKDTFIENDCKRLTQKPRHIELACGRSKKNQDDVEVQRIRYRKKAYGKNNARARGRLHVEGLSGKHEVKLRFKKRKNCAKKQGGRIDKNDPVYRKLTIKFKGGQPAGLKKRYNERLGCG